MWLQPGGIHSDHVKAWSSEWRASTFLLSNPPLLGSSEELLHGFQSEGGLCALVGNDTRGKKPTGLRGSTGNFLFPFVAL